MHPPRVWSFSRCRRLLLPAAVREDPAADIPRGTRITLHLKPDANEFADQARLQVSGPQVVGGGVGGAEPGSSPLAPPTAGRCRGAGLRGQSAAACPVRRNKHSGPGPQQFCQLAPHPCTACTAGPDQAVQRVHQLPHQAVGHRLQAPAGAAPTHLVAAVVLLLRAACRCWCRYCCCSWLLPLPLSRARTISAVGPGWRVRCLLACPPARPPPSSSPCFTPLLLPTLTHSLQVVDEEATAKNQAEADKQAAEEGNEGGADKMPPGGRPAGGGWRPCWARVCGR